MQYDYLILTEKKTAFDSFVKALGGEEGNFNGHSYKLVHSQGHLLEFADPSEQVSSTLKEKYSSWKLEDLNWNLRDLNWKKVPKSYAKKFLTSIRQASHNAKSIIIATDTDPSGEGELLAWEIINAIGWQGKVYRENHADESPKSIVKALGNLKDVSIQQQDGEFLKADARSKWDFCSLPLTRAATTLVRNAGYKVKVVNQGRLKSVMISLIFKQWQEIKNYKRRPYYEVRFKDDHGHVYKQEIDANDEQQLKSIRHVKKADAEQELQTFPGQISVVNIKQKKMRNAPNTLLDMAKIDGLLSKQGYSSKMIKETYQVLYENNYLSYPRTEDKVVTSEQFNELVHNRDKLANLLGINTALLTHLEPRKKLVKDSATHGANRPGSKIPTSLDELRQFMLRHNNNTKAADCAVDIYRMLVRCSLAILGEDYLYERVTAELEGMPGFTTHFNRPISLNYKQIYDDPCEKNKNKQEGNTNVGTVATPFVYEGSNPKPKAPTKSWLYSKLSNYGKYGVGTGATQQSTMADITDIKSNAHLLNNKRGTLSLTQAGLYSAITGLNTYIASPKVTVQLFNGMDAVGQLKLKPENLIASVLQVIKHDIPVMERNIEYIKKNVKGEKYQKAERVSLTYQGHTISLKRTWGKHTFTDDELKELEKGHSITFDYGKGEITGQLMPTKFHGKTYINFTPDFQKNK